MPNLYYIEGIKVYSPKYVLIPKISEGIHDWLMARSIKRFLLKLQNKYHFDVINSKWLYPDACAIDHIFKDSGIPHITAGLGSDINYEFKNNAKKHKILKMLNNTDATIVVSGSLKDILVNAGVADEKIHVIHNGVDTTQFSLRDKSKARAELNINQNEKIIIFVGRLSLEKGITTLIDALKIIISNQHDISLHLYLIGDGPLREALENQVLTLGLSRYVTFIGKTPHSNISKWMSSADIFCLPSFNEGCPNVVLEALGSGRPVVASRVGAIPDVVSNKSGILFSAGNVNELASALTRALEVSWDPHIIQSSIAGLSWESSAQKYLQIFTNAIHKQKS